MPFSVECQTNIWHLLIYISCINSGDSKDLIHKNREKVLQLSSKMFNTRIFCLNVINDRNFEMHLLYFIYIFIQNKK